MDQFVADIIIPIALLVLLCALGLSFLSVFHSLKVNKRKPVENGVKVGLIGWATFIMLLCISLPFILFGSFTDMCIITPLLMLFISGCCILYSMLRATRLRRSK
jgi:hypothetical protein